MFTDVDIVNYYITSQTSYLNLNSLDMEKLLQTGSFGSYHKNIPFTIYALLRTYKEEFSEKEEDYRKTVGGFKQTFGDRLKGIGFNYTYNKRVRYFSIEGYWVFEEVEHLYDYEKEYPNNVKNVESKHFEELFDYILKGYREHLVDKYGINRGVPETNKHGYLKTRREILDVMSYYIGNNKALEMVNKYMLSEDDIHKNFKDRGWSLTNRGRII